MEVASRQRDPQACGEFLRGGARTPTPEVVAFIDANKDQTVEGRPLGVEPICAVLQVAPSTYYAARDRAPSARTVNDAVVTPELVRLWMEDYCATGFASSGGGRPCMASDRPGPDRSVDACCWDRGRETV